LYRIQRISTTIVICNVYNYTLTYGVIIDVLISLPRLVSLRKTQGVHAWCLIEVFTG